MIVSLMVMIGINFILAFVMFRNKLTSISLWVSGMMLAASVAYIVNLDYFGRDLSAETILVVEGCILFYFIGEALGQKVHLKVKDTKVCVSQYDPSIYKIILVSIVIILVGAYKMYLMYKFAISKGHSDIVTLISFMRPYLNSGSFTTNAFLSMFASFAEATSYVFIFYFLSNLVYFKKVTKKLILPVISYFIFLISTTGRTGYLRFFIITLGILYILLRANPKKANSIVSQQFIKHVILVGIIMVIVFYAYGTIFRHSSRTLGQYFGNYFSAGLLGLDSYFGDKWDPNIEFGQYTLSNIYYYLNKIFGSTYYVVDHNLPFFSWENSRSNIYTAFVLPLQDYGVTGLFLTRIFIAFLYTCIENYALKIKIPSKHILSIIIFGYFLYIVFSTPIADRFIELITVTTFPSLLIFILLVNKFFEKRKSN